MAIEHKPDQVVIVYEKDCELERWDDDVRGKVFWRTLISGDRTHSRGLTCGIAELPVGHATKPSLHQHSPVEIYYILEGSGQLIIDEKSYEVATGATIYIPENALHGLLNTGNSILSLLYVFPVNSFDEVRYVFPGNQE